MGTMERRGFIKTLLGTTVLLFLRPYKRLIAQRASIDDVYIQGGRIGTVTLPPPNNGSWFRITNTGDQALTVVDGFGRHHHLEVGAKRTF